MANPYGDGRASAKRAPASFSFASSTPRPPAASTPPLFGGPQGFASSTSAFSLGSPAPAPTAQASRAPGFQFAAVPAHATAPAANWPGSPDVAPPPSGRPPHHQLGTSPMTRSTSNGVVAMGSIAIPSGWLGAPVESFPQGVKPESDTSGVGISGGEFASRNREVQDVITDLKRLGLAGQVDLPELVVIGNQSAGKSSVIESITGIDVPRESGTCTRCPFEIRQKRSLDSQWRCQVSIRFDRNDVTGAATSAPEINFGPVLHSPDLLANMLVRAQLAILHPLHYHADFALLNEMGLQRVKNGDLATVTPSGVRLGFSSNRVCVDIEGPDCCDLTFVDLPGIIQTAVEGGSHEDIDLIKNIVKGTIARNCLILAVISMKDEMQNQGAFTLALEADPEGDRTIGVLTKPDTIERGEHDRWLKVLKNESSYHLKLGYFCTRNPATGERDDKTYAKARGAEADFFKSTAPWKSLDFKTRDQLGTKQLEKYLSAQYIKHTRTELPKVMRQVDKRLIEVSAQMSDYPEEIPEAARFHEAIKLINTFVGELRSMTDPSDEASEHEMRLIRATEIIFAEFRTQILATEPVFIPFPAGSQDALDFKGVRSCHEQEGPVWSSADRQALLEKSDLEKVSSGVLRLHLDEVHRLIQSSRGRQIAPFHKPYGPLKRLLLEAVQTWGEVSQHALVQIHPIVTDEVDNLIKKHFGRYPDMAAQVQEVTTSVLKARYKKCEADIKELIDNESNPRTTNLHHLNTKTALVKRRLNRARIDSRRPLATTALVNGKGNGNGVFGIKPQSPPDDDDEESSDVEDPQWEHEIDTMANCQGYWNVAYKGFVDSFLKSADKTLVKRAHRGLDEQLITLLTDSETSKEAFLSCMVEEPGRVEEKAQLQAELTSLQKAKERLSKLKMK